MPPTASRDEVRAAYRRLAGLLHPDRHVDESPAERALAERRMREVNQAWQVLGDPAARARYDEELRVAARAAAPRRPSPPPPRRHAADPDDDDLIDSAASPARPMEVLMAGLPWLALLGVLAVLFVLSAYATGDHSTPKFHPTSGTPTTVVPTTVSSSCIRILAGPATTVVDCSQPNNGRIIARAAEPSACPAGTDARRLTTDGQWDCLLGVPGDQSNS